MQRRAAALLAIVATLLLTSSTLAAGKPGYPDKVTWNGVSWQVKTSNAAVGPGPNIYSRANVSVDPRGFLHLGIAKDANNRWTTSEVIAPTSDGYGTYTFTVATRLDQFDPNVVLGLFTWSDKAPYAHRELDVEVARWGTAADPTNAQFVVQPYNKLNHLVRFQESAAIRTVQRFTWRPGLVSFVSTRLDTGATVATYTYSGSDVPVPGDERVHLNLWLFNGAAPTNGQSVDVTVESFAFAP
jgi:hypothetical protein